MKTMRFVNIILFVVLLLPSFALGQTNEFSYQGRLNDTSGTAASYDFQFALYATAGGAGLPIGTRDRPGVLVSSGVFSVKLDFAATNFNGSERWLEIRVKPAGSAGPYTVLTPRQQVTSSPYSIRSLNSTSADTATNSTTSDNANQLNGFSSATTFTAAQRIYVSRTDGFLPNGTVDTLSISDGSISSNDLASSAVTNSKIAPDAVNTFKISDGAITASKLDIFTGLGMFSGSVYSAFPGGYASVNGFTPGPIAELVQTNSLSPNRICTARRLSARVATPLPAGETAHIILLVNNSITNVRCQIDNATSVCTTTGEQVIQPSSLISMQILRFCGNGGCVDKYFYWGWECR